MFVSKASGFAAAAVIVCTLNAANAQDNYVYGGLSFVSSGPGYTYTAGGPGFGGFPVEVSLTDNVPFIGYGRVLRRNGNFSLAVEADVMAGGAASGRQELGAPPCITPGQACTLEIDNMVSVRFVYAEEIGAWKPFATWGLAAASVSGSADTGACAGPCDFDETLFGFSVGLGTGYRINEKWSARAEVLYSEFNAPEFTNPVNVTSTGVDAVQLRFGASYTF